MAQLDRAVGHRVGRLQPGNDLAGREYLNLELVLGRLGDGFGEDLGATVQRVERFRKARRAPPLELRHGLGDRRLDDRRGGEPGAGRLEYVTTFHLVAPGFEPLADTSCWACLARMNTTGNLAKRLLTQCSTGPAAPAEVVQESGPHPALTWGRHA